MAAIPLLLTSRQYTPDLNFIRKTVVLNREGGLTRVRVKSEWGGSVDLFLNPADLYIVGIDFGGGPFHFSDHVTPAIEGSTPFEFRGNYTDLGLNAGPPVELTTENLARAVMDLSYHKAGRKGSGFLGSQKLGLVRLIFTVSEALRFWTIQNDVQDLLLGRKSVLVINDYAGNGKPLNSWQKWSEGMDWPSRGVFVPAKSR